MNDKTVKKRGAAVKKKRASAAVKKTSRAQTNVRTNTRINAHANVRTNAHTNARNTNDALAEKIISRTITNNANVIDSASVGTSVFGDVSNDNAVNNNARGKRVHNDNVRDDRVRDDRVYDNNMYDDNARDNNTRSAGAILHVARLLKIAAAISVIIFIIWIKLRIIKQIFFGKRGGRRHD